MSPGTETFAEDTHLHFPEVSRVKAGLIDDSTCTLKFQGQFLQEGLVLPIAQEAVCVHTVVLAIEAKVQVVVWRLGHFILGHKSDLCRGSPKV